MTCQNCVESSILITYKHVMSVALEKDRLLSAFNSLLWLFCYIYNEWDKRQLPQLFSASATDISTYLSLEFYSIYYISKLVCHPYLIIISNHSQQQSDIPQCMEIIDLLSQLHSHNAEAWCQHKMPHGMREHNMPLSWKSKWEKIS